MTDQTRRPQLTIVGMPTPEFLMSNGRPLPSDPSLLANEEPFPLTPYRDVFVHTPSGARERREATPVYVQPRPANPPRKQDPTLTLRSRVQAEPSAHAKRMAAVFVCWALAVWTALAAGGWLP